MAEQNSDITLGKSEAQIELEMLESMWAMDVEHCCFCEPQECGPHIPSPGDCGQHDWW